MKIFQLLHYRYLFIEKMERLSPIRCLDLLPVNFMRVPNGFIRYKERYVNSLKVSGCRAFSPLNLRRPRPGKTKDRTGRKDSLPRLFQNLEHFFAVLCKTKTCFKTKPSALGLGVNWKAQYSLETVFELVMHWLNDRQPYALDKFDESNELSPPKL